jgi:ABC-type phosphate/phosphonate transport system substrate-binding protein
MKVRFAMIAGRGTDQDAFAEIKALFERAGIDAQPAFVPSYAAMYGVLHERVCALGWAPPLVARDLLRAREVEPVALVMRSGGRSYYSTIVTQPRSRFWHLGQLEHARIGWVSRLSAAGYVVPRGYLSSRRIRLSFAQETFHQTHARAAEALERGTVDAIATYAVAKNARALHVPLVPACNVLAIAGPIPNELVVAAEGTDPSVVAAARDALLSAALDPNGCVASLGVTGFAAPPDDYADFLSDWDARNVAFTASTMVATP